MKKVVGKIFFLMITLTISTSMLAQDTTHKKSTRNITEAGERAHTKKLKQKQLHAAPVVIPRADSVSVQTSPNSKKKKAD